MLAACLLTVGLVPVSPGCPIGWDWTGAGRSLLNLTVTGEQLLGAGEVFAIRPLQLYAVTEQLQQGKPTCASGDAKTDLGHILDFTCRLRYLKVQLQQRSCRASLSWLSCLTAHQLAVCEGDQDWGLSVDESHLVLLILCFCL